MLPLKGGQRKPLLATSGTQAAPDHTAHPECCLEQGTRGAGNRRKKGRGERRKHHLSPHRPFLLSSSPGCSFSPAWSALTRGLRAWALVHRLALALNLSHGAVGGVPDRPRFKLHLPLGPPLKPTWVLPTRLPDLGQTASMTISAEEGAHLWRGLLRLQMCRCGPASGRGAAPERRELSEARAQQSATCFPPQGHWKPRAAHAAPATSPVLLALQFGAATLIFCALLF